jgi:tetratricopeptide (TPR) repeat protein
MRGLELAEKSLDPAGQLRLIGQLHMFHRRGGNFDRMLAFAQRSETVARAIADPIAAATANVLLGVSHHLIGNQAEARAHIEKALAQAPVADSAKARRFGFYHERARIVLARSLWLMGYPDRALEIARQTVRGLAATEPVSVCIALIWAACVFRWTGDLRSAEDCNDRLIRYADQQSLTPYRAVGQGLKGELLIERGEIDRGMDLLCRSLAILDSEGYQLYTTEFKSALAGGLAKMDRHSEALLTIDKAIADVRRHGDMSMPELQRIRGEVLAKTADEVGAEEAFRRAEELAEQQSALSWRLRASSSLARLQSRQGRREQARKGLADTYARFGEGFETADLKAAERLLKNLAHKKAGDLPTRRTTRAGNS